MNHLTTMVDDALGGLLSQFAESPNLRKLLELFVVEVQALEDTVYACVAQRMLETAVGAQLDQYGRVVGQHRLGLADDAYRKLLKVRIVANRSFGAAAAVVYCASILVDHAVRYRQLGPAHYRLDWETTERQWVEVELEGEVLTIDGDAAAMPDGSYASPSAIVDALTPVMLATFDTLYKLSFTGGLAKLQAQTVGDPSTVVVTFTPGLAAALGFAEIFDLATPDGYVLGEDVSVPVETSTAWLATVASVIDSMTPAGVSWSAVEGGNRGFRFDTPGRGFDAGEMGRRVR